MKVIGAGFGRTGTSSLKVALETLGFGPCYHMTEVFEHPGHASSWSAAFRGDTEALDTVLEGYGSAVDWPPCTFYKELLQQHPDAKVILTVRDPKRWYESVRNTIYTLSASIPRSPLYRVGFSVVRILVSRISQVVSLTDEIVWQGTFSGRFEYERHAIEVFEKHNEEVRQYVPQNQLLVYEVKEGWRPLCEFLDVREPDEAFPHANDRVEMRRRIIGIKAASVAIPAAALVLLARITPALLKRVKGTSPRKER